MKLQLFFHQCKPGVVVDLLTAEVPMLHPDNTPVTMCTVGSVSTRDRLDRGKLLGVGG